MKRIPGIAYVAFGAMLTFTPVATSAQQSAWPTDSAVCARMKSWMEPYLENFSLDTTVTPHMTRADSTRLIIARIANYSIGRAMQGETDESDVLTRLPDSSRASFAAAMAAGKLDSAKSILEATIAESGDPQKMKEFREELELTWPLFVIMPDTLRRDFAALSMKKRSLSASEREGCSIR